MPGNARNFAARLKSYGGPKGAFGGLSNTLAAAGAGKSSGATTVSVAKNGATSSGPDPNCKTCGGSGWRTTRTSGHDLRGPCPNCNKRSQFPDPQAPQK